MSVDANENVDIDNGKQGEYWQPIDQQRKKCGIDIEISLEMKSKGIPPAQAKSAKPIVSARSRVSTCSGLSRTARDYEEYIGGEE